MESPFYPWDLAHITEKRRFWINQQKRDVPAEKNEAEDTQHQMMNYLCKRLAAANVKRREQLDFWQVHPAQPSAIKLPDEPTELKPVATFPAQQLPKKAGPRSEISKTSQGTKHSFSTVAKSDLNDSATFSGRPRTEYVSSTNGGKYVLGVPPVPKVIDESPTFKCPYCSISLDGKSMLQRELWKKHVFRDLRPYVCTFERCENPEKLYLTRHDWIYHETQMHRRQWICASCSQQKFSSRSNMKSHLLEKHAGQFPESHITIMVDICERPMDDDGDADCPICLATLSFSALRTHLATHLEELALFVLPCHMEDRSQDVGSDKVEGATRQRLVSNASSSEDGLSPLDFEKSLPDTSHSQDPEIFSTLLRSTVEFENTDVDDWFVTNDQSEQQDNGDRILAIAEAYRNQGEWGDAEELEAQVMEMRNTRLGADHPGMRAIMAAQQALIRALEQQVNQQQKLGQPKPPPSSLTEDRVASLPPDLREQYIYSRQQFHQVNPQVIPPPMPEDMARFQSIKQEERLKFTAPGHLPMDQNTKEAVANKLVDLALRLSDVSEMAPRWFTITHDEDRLRTFFRTHLKVAQQFDDPSMQVLKQSFSMGLKDVDEALNVAHGMVLNVPFERPSHSRSQDGVGLANSQVPATSYRALLAEPAQDSLRESSQDNQTGGKNGRHSDISGVKTEDTITEDLRHTDPNAFRLVDSKEFRLGYVFNILWDESDNNEYDKQEYQSIRRFVIRKSRPGHSLCLPILNYGEQGTAKPGVNSAHHAIIFIESESASPPRTIMQPPSEAVGERPLPNLPICVKMNDPQDQLDVMSRLNYAKLYAVEHNIKVRFVGKIHEDSLKEFIKVRFVGKIHEDSKEEFMAAYERVGAKEEEEGEAEEEAEEEEELIHPSNRKFTY